MHAPPRRPAPLVPRPLAAAALFSATGTRRRSLAPARLAASRRLEVARAWLEPTTNSHPHSPLRRAGRWSAPPLRASEHRARVGPRHVDAHLRRRRKRGGVDSSLPGAQRPSATLASPHPGQGSGAPRHSECSAESSPRALDGRRTRRGGRPRTSGQMSSSPEEPSALLRHPPVASGQRPGSRRRATRGQAALLSALGQSRRQLTTEGRDADGSVCCGVEREVGLEAAVDERAADEAAKRLRLRRGRPHPYGGRVPSAGEGRGGCALAGAGRAPWSGPRRGGAAAGGGVGEERPAVEERAEEEPKEERPEEPHGLRREVRPGM